jgi:hypothetical protein
MNRLLVVGLACTTVGLLGYTAGIVVAYPGRSLSISLSMIGVTLLAIGVHTG